MTASHWKPVGVIIAILFFVSLLSGCWVENQHPLTPQEARYANPRLSGKWIGRFPPTDDGETLIVTIQSSENGRIWIEITNADETNGEKRFLAGHLSDLGEWRFANLYPIGIGRWEDGKLVLTEAIDPQGHGPFTLIRYELNSTQDGLKIYDVLPEIFALHIMDQSTWKWSEDGRLSGAVTSDELVKILSSASSEYFVLLGSLRRPSIKEFLECRLLSFIMDSPVLKRLCAH